MAPQASARITALLAAGIVTAAMAKLPAPSPEQAAQAKQAAARQAWEGRVAQYQLCRAQDAVAERYRRQMRDATTEVKPPADTAQCEDPGPYVDKPPPLEAAGAHSPPATALGPPSGKATEAELRGGVKR